MTLLTLTPLRERLDFCFRNNNCGDRAPFAEAIHDIAELLKLPLPKLLEAKLQLADSYILDHNLTNANKAYLDFWNTAQGLPVDQRLKWAKTKPALFVPNSFFVYQVSGDLPPPLHTKSR